MYVLKTQWSNDNISILDKTIDVSLNCVVISDGTRSYSILSDISFDDYRELSASESNAFGYSNCNLGIGLELTADNKVENAFSLKPAEFKVTGKEVIKSHRVDANCQVMDATSGPPITLWVTPSIPPGVNLGSCYTSGLSSALVKMTASNSGLTTTAILIKYEKVEFDFAPFEAIVESYKGKQLPEADLFRE
jgi:hypothetical protein